MDFRNLPKVELHLHLDCSLSYDLVRQLQPGISLPEYRASFVAPPKCTDLVDYLTRAVKGFELMQTKKALRLVTLDLFQQLKEDNVIYAEIRFAPLLHLQKGLHSGLVVETVNEAVEEGIRETGIDAGIILCTLRHYDENQSMETVKLVEQFKGTHVTGFDIAGDEAGFPVDQHVKAFHYAKEKGLNITAHAGEARGADSVWETLEHFRPSRIGHGARSAEDAALLQQLRSQKIHLEICPTSNIQTNVFDRIGDHSADKIYRSGVSMSINTDARAISDTTLSKEYEIMEKVFNWRKEDLMNCNLEAVAHSFTSPEIKEKLQQKIKAGFL